MNTAALFDLLRPWLASASGLAQVIEAHPGAPRPVGAYVLVNIIAAGPVHDDPYDVDWSANPAQGAGTTAEPLVEHPRVEWQWTVSVNVYAADAMDRARRIRAWATSASAVDRLFPLTISDASSTRSIPELVGERWEGRAQMDLTVRGLVTDTVRGLVTDAVPVDLIEEVTAGFSMARSTATDLPPMEDDEAFAAITVQKI